ncbi:MAG: helix-turn-helix domain-containing protein [Candidatus Azambacteria bacterium]|nr:helix-turn-helix domain-containing protein [Candidatus Azambacteria bacterium]
MIRLESEIKKLGLSDKEAKVYLAVLELGQASVAEIAVNSGVVRVTAYVILEELRKKGLVSTFLKGKKTIFAAEPPVRLKNLFETEKEKLEKNFSDLKNILPDLNKLYESLGERPKVRFFEGIEGIKAIREDILKTRAKNMEEIVPLDISHKYFPPSGKDHRKVMNEKLKHVNCRVIYTSKKGQILQENKGAKERVKFIKPELFPISSEVVLFGNKTIIVVTKNKKFGIIIEDELITKTFRAVFNVLWQNLR